MGFLNFGSGRVLRAGGFQPRVVTVTAATVTITAGSHSGRTIVLDRAAGIAVTLPAALGTGNIYRFYLKSTFTGDATIKVPNATDYMIGIAIFDGDAAADATQSFTTANTGTPATETDTVDMFDTGNVTGGIKGAVVELIDIASTIWFVDYRSAAAGVEVSPFKVTV